MTERNNTNPDTGTTITNTNHENATDGLAESTTGTARVATPAAAESAAVKSAAAAERVLGNDTRTTDSTETDNTVGPAGSRIETQTGSEYGHRLQPKIYAACLAAYNNGYLHGEWIYADQQPDDLMAEVWQMLEKSPVQPAEEFAIHDYEDFASFELHEYERLETVARIAGGLALHGAAFAHWAHETGSDAEDAIETFEDHYRGSYDSFEDLAMETLDDFGIQLHEVLPLWLVNHIRVDYDSLGRDLAMDFSVHEDTDGIHVFEAR